MTLVMRAVSAELRRSRRPIAPSQMATLARIGAAPCTMSALARHHTVTLPTISKSIDALARRGWVERSNDLQDRRRTIVRLTPGGRRVLGSIKHRAERHVARTLAPLSAADRAHVTSTLRALTKVLGPISEE